MRDEARTAPQRDGAAAHDHLALVLSGGGERALPWLVGVVAGLAESGLDPREADTVLGTSTGALVAGRVACGVDPAADADAVASSPAPAVAPGLDAAVGSALAEIVSVLRPSAPSEQERRRRVGAVALRPDPDLVPADEQIARQAARLPGGAWPSALFVATVDADSGELVALGESDGISVAEAVAAAQATPGVVEPVELGSRRLIDAGIRSGTNAELVPAGARRVVIVTATETEPRPGSRDDLWNDALLIECVALRARGADPVVIHASRAAQVAMGDVVTAGADPAEAVELGRAQGREAYARVNASESLAAQAA